MAVIVVAGGCNVETTLRVDGFPVDYTPVRYPFFGVQSSPSGVGYNVAAALATLGDEVRLVSVVGRDVAGTLVGVGLDGCEVARAWIDDTAAATPQSVVLYDAQGRRQVNTDLKDMQGWAYPADRFARALDGCTVAVITTINYTRALLPLARAAGVPIATDVQALSDLDDAYNRDYLAAADLLFMSGERLPEPPEACARRVMERYGPEILVIGLGAEGALLAVKQDERIERLPAVTTRPIVNTGGAGDALFSAFVHMYARTRDPDTALRAAIVFASHKIGEAGAVQGFLDACHLDALYRRTCDG